MIYSQEFKINEDFKGTDILPLGLTSSDYEKILNIRADRYRKTFDPDNEIDNFSICHIYYDKHGRSEGIEFWNNTKGLTFKGFTLMSFESHDVDSATEVANFFRSIDDEVFVDPYEITSLKYGIYICVNEGKIDSVLVCTKEFNDREKLRRIETPKETVIKLEEMYSDFK